MTNKSCETCCHYDTITDSCPFFNDFSTGECPNWKHITDSGYASGATHYQLLKQQPIEIMQILMSHDEFKGFLKGNVIKYALRQKGEPVKDMEKVQQYAEWYVQACEGKTIDPREA